MDFRSISTAKNRSGKVIVDLEIPKILISYNIKKIII